MTSRRSKEGDQWVDKDVTGWRCVAWEQFAENVAEQFRKG
jgi:single-stranded DNA-binding protein